MSVRKFRADLPLGWSSIRVSELMVDTGTINPGQTPEKIYELWSVPSFPGDTPEYVRGSEVGSNKQRVAPGDVLLCKINPRINRVWIVREKGKFEQIASTEWIVLRCSSLIAKFIMHQLREEGFRRLLCAEVSGVGGSLTRARPKIVRKLELGLAPLKEQERIVARLEELQARSRQVKEALEAVPDLLDQLRQSVLAAAFRGDSTRKWRKEHPDMETASELLKRIRIERRKRWEEAELEKLKTKGLTGEKLDSDFAKRRNQYKEPMPVDTSDLPRLPKGWCWASTGQLLWGISYGTAQKCTYESSGIGVLRIPNISPDGSISLADLKKARLPPEEMEKYGLSEGDILLIRSNGSLSLVGRTAVVGKEESDLAYAGYLVRLRPLQAIDSHWLHLALNTPLMRSKIEMTARSTSGVNNINSDEISQLPIPLAPIEEQTKIATLVTRQLAQLERMEFQHEELIDYIKRLGQSFLSKAFSGELVPQDPNDEPASALLDRIRAEKARASVEEKTKAKGKGRRVKRQPLQFE
jgi:type I restriction enzyme, S subunit